MIVATVVAATGDPAPSPADAAPALPAGDPSLMGAINKGADLSDLGLPSADSNLLGVLYRDAHSLDGERR